MLNIDVDKDLKIREELLSIHSLNPFCPHDSSVRSYMFSSHLSQSLVLNNPEESIIISGPEMEFIENTFKIKVQHEAVVKAIISRYSDLEYHNIETVIFIQYTVSAGIEMDGVVDVISIDDHFCIDGQNGFARLVDHEYINSLKVGDIIPAGKILADVLSTKDKTSWAYGLNANICLLNIPETAEDGVIISESFAKRLSYNKYEERVIYYDKNSYLLDVYGNNKGFPDIGEYIDDRGFIACLRDYKEPVDTALLSVNDVRIINPLHDKAFYTYTTVNLDPSKSEKGKVIDIKVYNSSQKDIDSIEHPQVAKYAVSYNRFYRAIMDAYKNIKQQHTSRFKTDLKITGACYALVKDAYGILGFSKDRTNYSFKLTNKNIEIKGTEIRFKILYENTRILIGNKISDKHGAKGVIVNILPDDQMPFTYQNGHKVVADLIMDPSSIISRMNIGRSYENYFGLMSRHVKYHLQNLIRIPIDRLPNSKIKEHFDYLLGFYKIIGTEQYDEYSKITDVKTMRDILQECIEKEVYIYYKISSVKKAPEIIREIKGTEYEPVIEQVHIPIDGKIVTTKNNIIIAPLYIILLNKTAENYLAVSSSKLNHFGLVMRINKNIKHSFPIRYTPTRILSETEGRLYLGYAGSYAVAELIDRATSIETHEAMYKNILESSQPTNIQSIVDRSKIPYGKNAALLLVNNLFNIMGLEVVYTEE